MTYLGHLSRTDPLHGYLRFHILPQLGCDGLVPDFRVYRLRASNHVYLYEEAITRTRVVGKFFSGVAGRSAEAACRRMEREFSNLNYLRGMGFSGYPHYIPRPLGRSAGMNCLLVEEFCNGTSLDIYILRAIREGEREALFEKLASLACFLATLHNRTATGDRVDVNRDCAYFDRIVDQLKGWGHIGWEEAEDLHRLKEQWREKGFMWEDSQVLVHGDATPANILFGDAPWVITVDLERMKPADRVFDVGRVSAEIKHFFMQLTGDKGLAEPFIGHFLWEYACHFPDRETAFGSIVRRVPFHMGITLLRIARNSWITNQYRRLLLDEARMTLR
ncbi:MAG: phosphotransferase [Thermodesulfobacteriota bacterium]